MAMRLLCMYAYASQVISQLTIGTMSKWGPALPRSSLASAALFWTLGSLVTSATALGPVYSSSILSVFTRPYTTHLSWERDPKPTFKGYLPVDESKGSALYYAYFEATAAPKGRNQDVPVVLWLQGGPGCASTTVGCFYENGPWSINKNLRLEANPGAWTDRFGMLYIDQPIGTGFSVAGNDSMPGTLEQSTQQLYACLQQFFKQHQELQARPFLITGESYAGKFIPALADYILHAGQPSPPLPPPPGPAPPPSPSPSQKAGDRVAQRLAAARDEKPTFDLRGVAIGNGLTDPRSQTMALSRTASQIGMVSTAQSVLIDDKISEVLDLVDSEQWHDAWSKRTALLDLIKERSGIGTMLDMRRYDSYDSEGLTNQYINLPEVRTALGVRPDASAGDSHCSAAVREAMAGDVMRSVVDLLPGIIAAMPVLLFQGQFDAQDGPASNSIWINSLEWPSRDEFAALEGELWEAEGRKAGWWRRLGNLTHAVVRNAGHMVPHDQPAAGKWLVQTWAEGVLDGGEMGGGGRGGVGRAGQVRAYQ